MNKLILIGRLTKDPELQTAQSGTQYAKFTLAVKRDFKPSETDFPWCTAFGKNAEILCRYCRKGSQIGVEGRIQTETREEEGKRRSHTSVVVDRIELLGSKAENGVIEPKPQTQGYTPKEVDADGFMQVTLNDEGLPFN